MDRVSYVRVQKHRGGGIGGQDRWEGKIGGTVNVTGGPMREGSCKSGVLETCTTRETEFTKRTTYRV